MSGADYDYTTGLRVERTLAYLRSIPNPVERARMCDEVAEQARAIQGSVGQIRRRAVYEATLRVGSTGASVAAELGISGKAVSLATKAHRTEDLKLLHGVLEKYLQGAASNLNRAVVAHARESRDVVYVATTVLKADKHRRHGSLAEDEWLEIDDAVKHAQRILESAAALPAGLRTHPAPMTDLEVDYAEVPEHLVHLCRTINALPGIVANCWDEQVTIADPYPVSAWYLSWSILPAEPHSSVLEAGPHREGWATTEWLVWLLRDLNRSGKEVAQYTTSPPPYLNTPGESLSFGVYAPRNSGDTLNPDDLADWVAQLWDETGYKAVAWPSPRAVE